MKVGVLGGTFNPVHNSHLYIAGEYARLLNLDTVLFIPTFTPPHKSAGALAGADDRLAMCALAVRDHPLFEICDYEAKRPEKSYTFKTLEYLKETRPGDELYFLMGADMFLTVQNWMSPERIYACATLCAAARESGELKALEEQKIFLESKGARCTVIAVEPRPLSSTDIRAAAAAGGDISNMVPEAVAGYIASHRLYREGETDV
ncbi:MAG: nicotinate-nucleotide adenylyltransferase [Oscillospiraceae bacterium]|jgi:nicotinate-nucleotide adenylyltransferase|nr:nicotinate-nucleotide adenylyltransferase [Oscillospiraceae bacterium]